MNTVSTILYLTAILPNIAWLATVVAVISAIVLIVGALFHAMISTDPSNMESDKKHIKDSFVKALKYLLPPFIVCVLISISIPDQKTMYMIAASEIGEEVIQTEEAKIIYQDIRDVLATYKKVKDEPQNNK